MEKKGLTVFVFSILALNIIVITGLNSEKKELVDSTGEIKLRQTSGYKLTKTKKWGDINKKKIVKKTNYETTIGRKLEKLGFSATNMHKIKMN